MLLILTVCHGERPTTADTELSRSGKAPSKSEKTGKELPIVLYECLWDIAAETK